MKKKLLVGTFIILALLVIIPTVSYFSLKNKDLRGWVSGKIESSTGIKVSMDRYEVSFPANVRVHKLQLETPSGIQASADNVTAHLSIPKLFTGSIYLKSIVIDNADITVPLNQKPTPPETGKENEKNNGKAEKTELPVGNLRIRNAVFHLIREGKETTISGIQLALTPASKFELTLNPGDPGNLLKLTGNMKSESELNRLNGSLKITRIHPLLKLFPGGEFPIDKLVGELRFSVKKSAGKFDFSSDFRIPTLVLTLDKAPLSYPLKGKLSGTSSLDGKRIVLRDAALTVRNSVFRLKGNIKPKTSIQFSGDHLSLQGLSELIPPSQSPFPEGTAFQGDVRLSGVGGTDGVAADLLLKDNRVTLSGMAALALNGKLHITEKQIQIASLLLNNPETDLTISGTIDQYLSDHGTTNLKIRGKMLSFISKNGENGKKASNSNKKNAKTVKTEKNKPIPVSYPDFEGMTHTIDCEIGAVILPGLTLSKLNARLVAGDSGTFLKKCTANTLDGGFTLSGKLLPAGKGIRFSAGGKAKALKLTGILSDKLPVKGGRLSASFTLSGSGADSEALKQKANGKVDFRVSEAILRDTPALEKIESLTGMKFIGKKIEHFNGEARIRNGKAEIKNTRMTAAGIRADFSGTVSLNGALNLNVPVQLSGEAGKKLPAKLRLLQSGGKVTLPLEIKGEIQKPKVKLNLKGAKKAIRKKLKKKLLDRLFGN